MNKTEITKAKKEELVAFLKNTNANLTGTEKREELVEMAMLALEMNNTSTNTSSTTTSPTVSVPTPNDESWTDYVLSLLWKNEIVLKKNGDKTDRYPRADGLRRIFEYLRGPIVNLQRHVIQAPSLTNDSASNLTVATVKVCIQYWDRELQMNRSFEEVADCYDGNTVDPFYRHPTGTASTMAEGRAFRKALHLKALTIEEMRAEKNDGGQIDDVEPINENQKMLITRLCDRLTINVDKTVEEVFGGKKKKENLTYSDAGVVIQYLNNLQQKGK